MKYLRKSMFFILLMSLVTIAPAQVPTDINIDTTETVKIDSIQGDTVNLEQTVNDIKESVEELTKNFPKEVNSKHQLDGLVSFLFGLLVLLGGYLSHLIPGLKSINDNAYRVFALGLGLVLSFTLFKGDLSLMDAINYFIGYGGAAALYSLIFKRVKKTPKPVTA